MTMPAAALFGPVPAIAGEIGSESPHTVFRRSLQMSVFKKVFQMANLFGLGFGYFSLPAFRALFWANSFQIAAYEAYHGNQLLVLLGMWPRRERGRTKRENLLYDFERSFTDGRKLVEPLSVRVCITHVSSNEDVFTLAGYLLTLFKKKKKRISRTKEKCIMGIWESFSKGHRKPPCSCSVLSSSGELSTCRLQCAFSCTPKISIL